MQVIILLMGAVGLVAGQCNNILTGNSLCNSASYSGAYSIFNVGNVGYGYGSSYSVPARVRGPSAGSSFRTRCLQTTPVPIGIRQLFATSPTYIRIVDDTEEFRNTDNICMTKFPLPDDPESFLLYVSTVYCDGTNGVSTIIMSEVGEGTFRLGGTDGAVTQRIFANIGGGALVACSHHEYGDRIFSQVFSVTSDLRPLGSNCVNQIADIVDCNGQGGLGLYVLPYRYPPRCVTQQVCSIPNPLLNCVNGNNCNNAYNLVQGTVVY